MKEKCTQCVLSTSGMSVDPNATDVVVRILGCNRFVPENSIWKTGVSKVLPGYVVECLRAIRRSHSINLDHDEAKLSLCLHSGIGTERFRDKRVLRTRVDVFNDWILFGSIEVCRANDDAPDVSLAITCE